MASRLPTWWHADDLTGPASLALLSCASKFDASRRIPFRAFARLAVEGACYSAARRSEYRERGHAELSEDDAILVECAGPETGQLPAVVWDLPPEQCRVVSLIYQYDLTLDRAASRMGVTPSRASEYHRRALDNLRGLLARPAA